MKIDKSRKCEGYFRTLSLLVYYTPQTNRSYFIFFRSSNANKMLKQEMKIYAVIVTIYSEYNIFEVANFLNVAKSFVYKIWIKLDTYGGFFNCTKEQNILKVRTLYEHRNTSSGFKTLLMMIPENQWGPSPRNFKCRSGL